MSDVTIYHNPRCSKSRQALQLIEQAGKTATVIKYLDTPPDASTLDALLKKLDLAPQDLMRKGEDRYAELGLGGKQLSREEAIATLVANPILIERPIVVAGDRAVVARPPERVAEVL